MNLTEESVEQKRTLAIFLFLVTCSSMLMKDLKSSRSCLFAPLPKMPLSLLISSITMRKGRPFLSFSLYLVIRSFRSSIRFFTSYFLLFIRSRINPISTSPSTGVPGILIFGPKLASQVEFDPQLSLVLGNTFPPKNPDDFHFEPLQQLLHGPDVHFF